MRFIDYSSIAVLMATTSSVMTIVASAIIPPQARATPILPKRQNTEGSAFFGNPSSAFQEISILLQNPTISSQFQSIATQPVYQSQLSSSYLSKFGTETTFEIIQSYNGLISSLLDSNNDEEKTEYDYTISTKTKDGYNSWQYNGSPTLITKSMMGSVVIGSTIFILLAF